MQFLKKNYEKVLLGLVLFGLVVAVVFMVVLVSTEKEKLRSLSTSIINRPVKALPPPDTSHADALLKRPETSPAVLDLSSNNKLFNPVRWMRGPSGPFRNEKGNELEKLELVRPPTPLYLTISLENVTTNESGARYAVGVQHEAAPRANQRGKRTTYISKGERIAIGDNKDALVLQDVRGQANDPSALVFQLHDTADPIVVTRDKPFRRIEGYVADLRYPPDNRPFPGRRVDDPVYGRIVVAGEEYNIVAITENEVVLSAKSNKKKYTLRVNAPR